MAGALWLRHRVRVTSLMPMRAYCCPVLRQPLVPFVFCILMSVTVVCPGSVIFKDENNARTSISLTVSPERVSDRDSDAVGYARRQRQASTFVEFYTGLSQADVDRETVQKSHSQLIDKLKLDKRMGMRQTEGTRHPSKINVAERLYFAVNYGKLPDTELVDSGDAADGAQSYWIQVKGEIVLPGSLLEIGDCVTAFQIAADFPTMTVIAIVMTETNIQFCSENARSGGLDNYNLAYVRPEELSELVEKLYSNPEVLFGNVFLSNLTQLSEGLLPHELEEMFARILSFSLHTFVMNAHVGRSMTYFTSQWTSLRDLMQRSCRLGGLDCIIDSPYGGAMWKNSGTLYKVKVTHGSRDLPVTTCNQLTNRPDCVLLYSNDSTRIQSSDGRMFPISLNHSTVPLPVMLDLNPVMMTREKLFAQMLMLPSSADVSWTLSTLSLSGGSLTWAHQTSKSSSMTEVAKPRRKGLGTDTGMGDTAGYENEMGKSWKALLQDTGRLSDKEQVDEFENKKQNDANDVRDGEAHQDTWFDGIDKLWNHVRQGKMIELRKRERLKKEPQVLAAAQQAGEEPDMTKDELELHKAIGFLHGDSKVRRPQKSKLMGDVKTNTLSPAKSSKTSKTSSVKYTTTAPEKRVPRRLDLLFREQESKTGNNNMAVPNLARPPQQAPVQNMQAMFVKEEGTVMRGQPEEHPLQEDKLRIQQKGPDQDQTIQTGQRKLLMLNQPSLAKTYISSLQEHSAKLRLENAPKEGASIMSAAQTNIVGSSSRVEVTNDISNAIHSDSTFAEMTVKSELSRPFHHAFNHQSQGQHNFDHYWRILKPMFVLETELADPHFNLLTFGDQSQSLLGMKVAGAFPGATVISVMPSGSQSAISSQRKAMKVLSRQNYMLLVNDMGPDVMEDLTHLPELFRFQVLGVEVFTQLLVLGKAFLYYLGQWMLLARTTILEVPRPEMLQLAYTTLSLRQGEETPLLKGLVEQAIKLVGGTASNIQILPGVRHHGYRPISQRRLLKIEMETLHRQVFIDCGKRTGDLQLRPGGVTYLQQVQNIKENPSLIPLGRSAGGVGLEFILRLGPASQERKSLFVEYLGLPVYSDMCPFHLVYFNETLIHHDVSTVSTSLSSAHHTRNSVDTQLLLKLLSEELGEQPFSFMEYNSKQGSLISSLSARYRNSTFVSLQDETTLAKKLHRETRREQLDNLVICQLNINRDFTQKMLKSPDFLRYQYISALEYVEMMKKTSRLQFNRMQGEIIATAVTTFIQVPSAMILSLAMSTFFPEKGAGFKEDGLSGSPERFSRDSHPLPIYKDAELKFMKQSAKADVNITVSATVLKPSKGSVQSWRLVRIDVKNLSAQVDHHFDYTKDGHSRKYQQHCVSHNKTSYEVFLIREQDGFKIPYGQVYAISLIALLRIGLLEEIKADFYDKFLKLPLYEDMAPWNIVFKAGSLDYIDYDSKDVTFDKMAPAAYQILAMLMNYERTVKDFGHCDQHAKNQYQFKLISNCVGNSEFDGPCKDSRYPVPCGDHTCRSTFIECLQVLNNLEKQKSTLQNTEFDTRIHPMTSVHSEKMSQRREAKEWSYGFEGEKSKS